MLLSHRTAYMNQGRGVGGVSYYVTAVVVRCAQVLYTENRQGQKSVEFFLSILTCAQVLCTEKRQRQKSVELFLLILSF